MSANQPLMSLRVVAGLLGVAATMVAGTATPMQEGSTVKGGRYASGGVSDDEQSVLRSQQDKFNLWIVTAARKSGAYLSNVHVKVFDAKQQVVLDSILDGPWLLAALPEGRYVVEARFNGEIQRRAMTLRPGGRQQAVLYFNVDADVATPSREPDPDNRTAGRPR